MQPDLNQMMMQAQKMQKEMERLQGELAVTPVEGSAGGGAVKITCTGALDFTAVKIQPEAIDSDAETLEDLVLTAIKDACNKAKDLGKSKMSKSLGNLPLPPGLGF